ncbi:MAG: EAL and HDOD domain-containing protein [Gemmatimonadales bacterium]
MTDIFVARQPIFDQDRHVQAYELLFRGGRLAGVGGYDHQETAIRMLNNTVMGFGLDALLGGKPGLLAIPHEVLLGGEVTALPSQRIVLHVAAPNDDDPQILAACEEARRAGFGVALSDESGTASAAMYELADYINVDFRRLDDDGRRTLATTHRRDRRKLIAKHVTSYAEFYSAQEAGFDLFQGSFFCEPEVFSGKDVSATSHSMAMLIAEVNRPEIDLDALEELIKRDIALSVKLLRYLNSAGMGWRHEVSTIGQALRLLGQRPARKWASLVAMTMIPADKPRELVTTSLIRGQFCEEIGAAELGEQRRPELFLVGLLSTLDALLDRPLPLLVSEMALSPVCSAALLGEDTPLGRYLGLTIAYDQGDWDRVDALCAKTGLAPELLPEAYHKTLAWVGEVMRVE